MGDIPEKKYNPNIKRVIGVTSGKGGVGKSTVSVLLAQALAARGLSVGLLDADITGPSIPRLLGVHKERGGERLFPVDSPEGIKVLSINLFHENEDDPVVWRGPMLGKALEQFWADTEWGALDWLIVDFPPGTSDVALTAFQTIPFSGIVIVGTPQDYVSMIVSKAVKMASMLEAPVLGMVETMRTMVCPSCGKEVDLFTDGGKGDAKGMGLPLLGKLPWRRQIVQASSLSWAALPKEIRKEADDMASAVELAVAAVPVPTPSSTEDCGGGCECGTASCCSGCASAPEGS